MSFTGTGSPSNAMCTIPRSSSYGGSINYNDYYSMAPAAFPGSSTSSARTSRARGLEDSDRSGCELHLGDPLFVSTTNVHVAVGQLARWRTLALPIAESHGSSMVIPAMRPIHTSARMSSMGGISTSGTFSAVDTTYGTASTSPTSFSVSGTNLTNNLIVTPPAGFEVSTSSAAVMPPV